MKWLDAAMLLVAGVGIVFAALALERASSPDLRRANVQNVMLWLVILLLAVRGLVDG